MFKYYPEISPQERENVLAQQIVLRLGNHLDAIKEVAKLPFLPYILQHTCSCSFSFIVCGFAPISLWSYAHLVYYFHFPVMLCACPSQNVLLSSDFR